jgi:hypothetical protein
VVGESRLYVCDGCAQPYIRLSDPLVPAKTTSATIAESQEYLSGEQRNNIEKEKTVSKKRGQGESTIF